MSGHPGALATPPLRRDAAANRERILRAAVEVFSTSGLDAGIDEVARRAGVGVGTVYRRFPTKEALVEEIVADLLRGMVDVAQRASHAAPEDGFAEFLRGAGELQARHAGCLWQLWSSGQQNEEILAEMRSVVHRLLLRAQESGAIRADLVYEDVGMLLWQLAGVVESVREVDPQLWRRALEIMLLGITPGAQAAHQPPTLTQPPLYPGGLDEVARQARLRRSR